MEALAYLHLCTAREEAEANPDAGKLTLFENLNWQLPCSAWIRLTSVLIAISILSLSSSSFAYTATVKTNGSPLNVRTGPGMGYRVVDTLSNGTRISLNGDRSDSWSQLSRVRNWVSSYWISHPSRGGLHSNSGTGRHYSSSTTSSIRYSPYVASLQKRLRDLGYFTGRVTGFYGSKTDSAVKRYQTASGVPAYGIDGLVAQGGEGPGNTTPIAYNRPLQYGDSGTDVGDLQDRLHSLGYFTGRTTQYYDRTTAKAVSSFQSNNGLPTTGTADTATQDALNSYSAVAAGSNPSGGSNASITPYRSLRYGLKGNDVGQLQQNLKSTGYFTAAVTKFYDHATESAVKKFQGERLGIDKSSRQYGNADESTQRALISYANGSLF